MSRWELADFHPEDGHLHTCNRVGPCACAAALYCVAHDAEMTAEYGSAHPFASESTCSPSSEPDSSTGSNDPLRLSAAEISDSRKSREWTVLATVTDATPEQRDALFAAVADAARGVDPSVDVNGQPFDDLIRILGGAPSGPRGAACMHVPAHREYRCALCGSTVKPVFIPPAVAVGPFATGANALITDHVEDGSK